MKFSSAVRETIQKPPWPGIKGLSRDLNCGSEPRVSYGSQTSQCSCDYEEEKLPAFWRRDMTLQEVSLGS